MYNALDVARYIIDYEATQGRTVSNLRLQKLLYFVQCAFPAPVLDTLLGTAHRRKVTGFAAAAEFEAAKAEILKGG